MEQYDYRCEATTLEGFIQQLAVGYVARKYFFYVTGVVPTRIPATEHDLRLIEKFNVSHSKSGRYRRRQRRGPNGSRLANVQYIRYGDFWVLLATDGYHKFFEEHQTRNEKGWRISNQYKDIRDNPICFGGYSIGWRNKSSVRMSSKAYRELKSYLVELAPRSSSSRLGREFRNAPFEAYSGVTRQMFSILRAVDRSRKVAGLKAVSRECIRVRRKTVRPFAKTEFTVRLLDQASGPVLAEAA